jgi:branched-chain amino acid transport system substrate-binding protein
MVRSLERVLSRRSLNNIKKAKIHYPKGGIKLMRGKSAKPGAFAAVMAIMTATMATLGVPAGGAATVAGITQAQINYVKPDKMIGPVGTGLTRGVTSTSVKVGCAYNANDGPGTVAALAAYYKTHQKKIYGRTVDVQPCVELDSTNPASELAIIQQMVEQDSDFAIILDPITAPAITTFMNDNQVPGITYAGSMSCGTRWGFGTAGCFSPDTASPPLSKTTYGWTQFAPLQAAANNLGIAKADRHFGGVGYGVAPASMSVVNDTLKLAKAAGYKTMSTSLGIPLTPGVNFTPYAQTIVSDGVNLLALGLGSATVAALVASLKSAGYKGAIMDSGSSYIPGGLAASQSALGVSLNSMYSDLFDVVPYEAQTPYVKEMVKGLAAIGKKPADVSEVGTTFYYGADMLDQMLEATGKNLNTKTFDMAVNGGKFVYKPALAGGPGTVPFPAGHFTAANCNATVQTVNGKWKVISGLGCADSPPNTNPSGS